MSKKYELGFTVSSLTDYTAEATELLRAGILFNDDMKNYSFQTGVKYIEPLNIISTEVVFQPTECGLNQSGDTTFTEKDITVSKYAVKKRFCVGDLENKNLPLAPGSSMDSLDNQIEVILTQQIQDNTKLQVEQDLWLGTSTFINGWFDMLSACTGAISLDTYSATTVTSDNVDNVVDDFMDNVTDDMWSRGVLTIHCSVATYNLYKRNRLTANYFHDKQDLGAMENWVFGYEGQVKIKGEAGLAGSNYMMLTWDKNLWIAVDEENELSYAKWIFDDVTDYLWYKQYFKLGQQIAFCGECIHNMY